MAHAASPSQSAVFPARADVPAGAYPDLPPPAPAIGPLRRLMLGLFGSPAKAVLTLAGFAALALTLPDLLAWSLWQADWSGQSRLACTGEGACWAVITARWKLFLYHFYPDEQSWRLLLAALGLPLAAAPLLWWDMPARRAALIFAALYPLLAIWLIGGGFGLAPVSTSLWGGLMLTLILGVTGIAASLPVGILLALGRRSDLPVLRMLSIGFIEAVRGVPLVTILFFASVMLPLFLPEGLNTDKLVRAVAVIILFSSAYMAEVLRGGFQAIPKGQGEAALALGLGQALSLFHVVLPQVLRISIPGIVNTFIGLFKDTSLVFFAIGLVELVGAGETTLTNQAWIGLKTEVYVFTGLVFWVICFGMSRVSRAIEARLDPGKERS